MDGQTNILLITRPQPRASADAGYFQSRGIHTQIASVLRYKAHKTSLPEPQDIDALIVTSARAVGDVESLAAYHGKPVYCVGPQSEHAAKDAGFETVYSAAGTAYDLMALIQTREKAAATLLYLRGEHVSSDIESVLESKGFRVLGRIVYFAEEVEKPGRELLDLLREQQIAAVSFYSKRSAEIFTKWVKTYGLEDTLSVIKALCISEPVLECVRVLPWLSTQVSDAPDGDAMRRLCLAAMDTER